MMVRSLYLKIISAVVVFGSWEIGGRSGVSFAFPPFSESMVAFWVLVADGTMFKAYAETLKPLVVGIIISGILGIILGIWIGLSEKFDWLISPIFIVMQSAPLAALIPLLIMAYGIGLTSKVFVVCIMAMPVIVLNTSAAVKNTPTNIKEMAKAYQAKYSDIIIKVILPASSPIIFAGLRLGVSAGFIGAILSELKITPTGVGDIISFSRSIADYPSMYAAIFSIILLAVLFLNILERTEKILFKGSNQGYVSD
jgi:NitT/TauT family transport system permease protein